MVEYDHEHPLKPIAEDGNELDPTIKRLYVRTTRKRLQGLYDSARANNDLTFEKWARFCGKHRADTASNWLRNPQSMDRKTVLRTCELFGCSLDYLQGATDWKASTEGVMDADELRALYKGLNEHHRGLVSKLARELSLMETLEGWWRECEEELEEMREAHPPQA